MQNIFNPTMNKSIVSAIKFKNKGFSKLIPIVLLEKFHCSTDISCIKDCHMTAHSSKPNKL